MQSTCNGKPLIGFRQRFEFALAISGLTTAQFDRRMGWVRRHSAMVISGKRPEPPQQCIPRIANALNVNAEWLAGGDISADAMDAIEKMKRAMEGSSLTEENRRMVFEILQTQ